MGVTGLLKLLRPAIDELQPATFHGRRVGFDAMWLLHSNIHKHRERPGIACSRTSLPSEPGLLRLMISSSWRDFIRCQSGMLDLVVGRDTDYFLSCPFVADTKYIYSSTPRAMSGQIVAHARLLSFSESLSSLSDEEALETILPFYTSNALPVDEKRQTEAKRRAASAARQSLDLFRLLHAHRDTGPGAVLLDIALVVGNHYWPTGMPGMGVATCVNLFRTHAAYVPGNLDSLIPLAVGAAKDRSKRSEYAVKILMGFLGYRCAVVRLRTNPETVGYCNPPDSTRASIHISVLSELGRTDMTPQEISAHVSGKSIPDRYSFDFPSLPQLTPLMQVDSLALDQLKFQLSARGIVIPSTKQRCKNLLRRVLAVEADPTHPGAYIHHPELLRIKHFIPEKHTADEIKDEVEDMYANPHAGKKRRFEVMNGWHKVPIQPPSGTEFLTEQSQLQRVAAVLLIEIYHQYIYGEKYIPYRNTPTKAERNAVQFMGASWGRPDVGYAAPDATPGEAWLRLREQYWVYVHANIQDRMGPQGVGVYQEAVEVLEAACTCIVGSADQALSAPKSTLDPLLLTLRSSNSRKIYRSHCWYTIACMYSFMEMPREEGSIIPQSSTADCNRWNKKQGLGEGKEPQQVSICLPLIAMPVQKNIAIAHLRDKVRKRGSSKPNRASFESFPVFREGKQPTGLDRRFQSQEGICKTHYGTNPSE
eukprot:g60852.t1